MVTPSRSITLRMGESKLDSLFVEYDVMYEYKDLEVDKIFVEYSPITSPQLDLLLGDSLDVVMPPG